jgi:hypothetical protein
MWAVQDVPLEVTQSLEINDIEKSRILLTSTRPSSFAFLAKRRRCTATPQTGTLANRTAETSVEMGLVGEAARERDFRQAFRRRRNQELGALDAPDGNVSHRGVSQSELERAAEMALAECNQRG